MNRLIIILLLTVVSNLSIAQNVAINEDGSNPDSTAMLDIQSTSMGFLVPRLTAAQRHLINGPATGLLVYKTDKHTWVYDNHESALLTW